MTQVYNNDPELARILTARGLTPTQRIIAATLRIKAAETQHDPAAQWWELPIDSIKQLADICGMHENTAGPTLDALHNSRIASKQTERTAVNRLGEPIDARYMDTQRGDRWHVSTTIAIAAKLPAELKAPTTDKAKGDKARAADNRELAKMAKRALSLPCPHCGVIGELHISCGACGYVVKPATDNAPQQTNTPPDPELCRAEHDHPAARRDRIQRLRTAKGRHTAPVDTPALDPEPTTGVLITARVQTDDSEKSHVLLEVTESVTPDFVTYVSDATIFGVTTGAQKGQCCSGTSSDGLDYRVWQATDRVLSGSKIIDMLAGVPGVKGFFAAEPDSKAAINPRDDKGYALNWRETPMTADAARRVLTQGKVAGVLCGPELRVLDIDAGALEFVKAFPQIGMTSPRVWRDNDTGRVKLFARVIGAPDKTVPFKQSPDALRRVEVLPSARIAGPHPSGVQLQAIAGSGDLAVIAWDELAAQLAEWAGVDNPTAPKAGKGEKPSTLPSVPHASNTNSAGEVEAVLHWWMSQPANMRAVDELVAKQKHNGEWFALRNERTPSVRLDSKSMKRKGRRVYRDFGSGENFDDFELYVQLGGYNKRAEIARVCAEWRAAGRP